MHGWGIGTRIEQISKGRLEVNQGSLYPALQRMRQKGWIKAEWRQTAHRQRARYYHITTAGRRALGEQQAGFDGLIAAVKRVMRGGSHA